MGLTNAQRQQRWRVKRDARLKNHPDVIERELVAAVALADRLSSAATDHLRRSQELVQLAWRIRFLLTRTCIVIVLLTALAPAQAQDATFHDRAGRVTGSARTDPNGVTIFHDRAGRVTGTARTDRNGVTTFKDAAGRTTGSMSEGSMGTALAQPKIRNRPYTALHKWRATRRQTFARIN
jgi:hypothetical protein